MVAWVAPAIGAAAGVASSFLGGGDSSSEVKPPGYTEDANRQYWDRLAKGQFSGSPGFWESYNPQMYQGNMVANQSPFTKMALRRMGGQSNAASKNYYKDVLAGDYLGLNPAMQQAVMDPAIQQTNNAFNQMGRFGSQANMENTAQAGMSALMPYYNAERARMGSAAAALPQLRASQNQQMLQAGQLQDQYKQSKIDEKMYRNDFKNNKWLDRMQQFQGLLGAPINGGTTVSSQPGQNPFQGAFGGGLMGAAFGNAYGGGSQAGGVNPYSPSPTGMPANMDLFNEWGIF